jgi:hypothetical protein
VTDYDTMVLARSPQAYWKLDDVAGPLVDSSGNGHSLTLGTNEPEQFRVAGPSVDQIPYAIDWNAVGGAQVTGNTLGSFAIGASFLVECWFGSVGTPPQNIGCVTKGYRSVEARPWWSLGVGNDAKPFFWFRNAAGTDFKLVGQASLGDATYIQRGPFHHLVGVYLATSALASLYVDGVLLGTLTVPNTGWGTGAQPLQLENLSTFSGGNWLAAVALYGATLSSTDINGDFTLGLSSTTNTTQQVGVQLASIDAKLDEILAAVRKSF